MNIKHVYMGWSPAATLVAVVMMGAMNVFAQPYTPEAGKGSDDMKAFCSDALQSS